MKVFSKVLKDTLVPCDSPRLEPINFKRKRSNGDSLEEQLDHAVYQDFAQALLSSFAFAVLFIYLFRTLFFSTGPYFGQTVVLRRGGGSRSRKLGAEGRRESCSFAISPRGNCDSLLRYEFRARFQGPFIATLCWALFDENCANTRVTVCVGSLICIEKGQWIFLGNFRCNFLVRLSFRFLCDIDVRAGHYWNRAEHILFEIK